METTKSVNELSRARTTDHCKIKPLKSNDVCKLKCYKCKSEYTVTSLDTFFACTKCNLYLRYECDFCDRIFNMTLHRYTECVKCPRKSCRNCTYSFFAKIYELDSHMCKICYQDMYQISSDDDE